MKIRIIPLTITAALTAAILFGGWFAYRHYGIEKPLDRIANAVPGVTSAVVETTSGHVNIELKLEPNADIAAVFRQVKTEGASEIGGKSLTLSAGDGQSNEKLEQAWSYALFDVAQAMENRQYTGIRDAMNELSDKFPGVTASTSMDEDNVYVTLRDSAAAKFVILPREGATIGVWPNA